MAHVLLPCDLPNWVEIQRHLSQLKNVTNAEQLIQGMTKIYEMCCVSLEPEEIRLQMVESPVSRFDELKKFLEDVMSQNDRTRFFGETLPNLVTQALCLRLVKPLSGFLYSLKKEEDSFELDRAFVKSLLANAFFSTFPKRTPKTHPSLQNFSFCDFFQHLQRRSQQKKLRAFLRYFQKSDEKKKSVVRFARKVLFGKAQPSLPVWLCSDRPLIPLIVRQEGNIHDAEPNVCRAFPCCSLVGGDVLQAATSPESSLFFAFPELLCCLSFFEELEDNEAFLANSVLPHGIHKSRQISPEEVTICLMDSIPLGSESDQQFEDRSLLRELNKALATFSLSRMDREDYERKQRRQTPVGESSNSEQPSCSSSRRTSAHQEDEEIRLTRSNQLTRSSVDRPPEPKTSPYFPIISGTGLQLGNHIRQKDVVPSNCPKVREFPKLPVQSQQNTKPSYSESSRGSISSSHSSTRSLKTASESSLELPPIIKTVPQQRTADDEYYTADEDSDQCSSKGQKRQRKTSISGRKENDLSSLLLSTSSLVGEKPTKPKQPREDKKSSNSSFPGDSLDSRGMSSRRSDSLGFVLGGTGSDEDIDDFVEEEEGNEERGPPVHERLEDFRKRIRRRTRRHLSRKMRSSSRSSYSLGSSTSSDMEDISEEEDIDDAFHPQVMRASNSEPSLASIIDDVVDVPPFALGSDTVVMTLKGKKVVVTSSNGQLKAYSYDGVNPNLPVPFKAKFRTRRSRHPSEEGGGNAKQDDFWSSRGAGTGTENEGGFTDSDDESSQQTSSSRLSSIALNQAQESIEDENICRNKGTGPKCPVAVGPSKYGDPQLRSLILWLAASMAGLPSLIFYTGQELQLYELSRVYRKVLSRQWTIGDLSCELLRFCRNKLSPRRSSCSSSLFEQLLAGSEVTLSSSAYSQHSLD